MKGLTLALLAGVMATVPALGWTWSGYNGVTISSAAAYQSGTASPPGILIFLTSSAPHSEGCTDSKKGWAWIDFSSTGLPDGRTLYATVLTAQAAGKSVDIGLNGCGDGVPKAYAIAMHS